MKSVMAAARFFIRAQWSRDLWVWLHPLRLAADPQCCGRRSGRDGKITASEKKTTRLCAGTSLMSRKFDKYKNY